MKVAILGDLHFGARNNNPHILRKQREFFEEQFFPYLKENGIDHIIQVGDVFDQRRNINVGTMKQVDEFFISKLADMTYYGLLGNHDTYFRNTNAVNTPQSLMKGLVSNIAIDDVKVVKLGGTTFALVPWLTSENNERILKQMAECAADVCIGHFEINGFEMTKGNLCTHGLDSKMFKSFKKVISGHFHLRSKLGHIEYIGTPYWMDWNDWNTDKGFVVFDTETGEHEYVENPDQTFWKIPYQEGMHTKDLPEMRDCFIKLIVQDELDSKSKLDEFVQGLNRLGVADLQVVTEKQSTILEGINEESVDIDTDEALSTILDSVETSVDQAELKALILRIYTEARAQL